MFLWNVQMKSSFTVRAIAGYDPRFTLMNEAWGTGQE
jgi:hypothetical protein